MSSLATRSPFSTSIGRKFIVGVTGLFLCSFLVVHMSGNLLLLAGDGGIAFQEFEHFMSTNPVIRIMEVVLMAGLLLHIVSAISVTLKNRKARPNRYVVTPGNTSSSWYSRYMIVTGLFLLAFLGIHLANFWIENRFGTMEETMFEEVNEHLTYLPLAIFYIVSMLVVGLHLLHGFQSGFQTFGLQVNSQTGRFVKGVGLLFSVVITAGFTAIAVYFLLLGLQ